VVCRNNEVFSFGSVKEGFVGFYSDDLNKTQFTKEVYRFEAVTAYFNKQSRYSGSGSYVDAFTSARKLFNTRMNKLLKDNYYKKNMVVHKEKISETLRKEMDERIKTYVDFLDKYSLKFPCKEVSTMIEVFKYLDDKMKRVV
jgi:hypothetical protein